MNNPQAMKKLLNMKKLLMIVGMMLAAALAPVWAAEQAQPATDGKTPPATIAWGEAVDGVQVGLVPLGGDADASWGPSSSFQCHRHELQRHVMPSPEEKLNALKTRCCELCGAPKPWGATFVEGKPMRMELHVRNLANEARSLCNAGVRNAPGVCRYWKFTFSSAGGGTSWTAVWAVKPRVPPESDLKLGFGERNETALEQQLGERVGSLATDKVGASPASRRASTP